MKVYFLSATTCALTLNGGYFGITDGFERFAELSLKDNIFAQFTPENALPIGCFLSENLRFSPPDGFEVYLLPDGIALYARDFPPRDFRLKTIDQQRKESLLVTLFQQGEVQLSIERQGQISLARLSRAFAAAKICFIGDLVGVEGENRLALFTPLGECVFEETILSYAAENGELTVLLPLLDSLGRIAECTYRLTENGCERTAISLRQARAENGETDEDSIEKSLLPFAFFESVLLGLNFSDMLSAELSAKSNDLREFLGDFIAVIPTKNANVCGLVRKKSERLYEVSHFTVNVENGKIVDIRG